MRYIHVLKESVKKFLRWLFPKWIEQRFIGKYVEDVPYDSEIKEGIVYIVGENGYEWVIVFLCPCGCRDLIQLNLLEGVRPRWKILSRNLEGISITPSIDRKIGCRSHFTITHGRIKWWDETPQ